ncbi:glycosyltransferase family 2 protein [uncultured Imperialibacter sp.]|uniref:glycosyltransferase family 2 protein n=1 Tax=uncultured Imperialibacter sp. TaxID=1672639 RepID=UPI0030DD8E90|tara:strand:+ start:127006 stop:127767 length:762 start_codon:yes stop_codon:yes gene_type:complete
MLIDRCSKSVSIITPLFNAELFIANAINSVVKQTFHDWEMIVVDDGSTDGSVEIVRSFAKKDSRIILLLNNENKGPAFARNCAIEKAQGKYVAFLDADDQWLPQKLQQQIAFMKQSKAVFCFSDYSTISEEGDILKKGNDLPKRLNYSKLLRTNYIGCLTAIYDAEALGKMYMPQIKKRQDYGLWLSILKKTSYAYCVGDQPLALYTQRSMSVSSNKIKLLKYNWKLFYEVERLSFLKSCYFLFWNVVIKVFK